MLYVWGIRKIDAQFLHYLFNFFYIFVYLKDDNNNFIIISTLLCLAVSCGRLFFVPSACLIGNIQYMNEDIVMYFIFYVEEILTICEV